MKKFFKRWQFALTGLASFGIAVVLGIALFGTGSAYALTAPTNILTSTNSIVNIFCGLLNWLFWFLIVLSIVMALIAAYTYVTSGGDAEKVSKATKTLTYAAIAIVVAIMAGSFPVFIASFFSQGGSVSGACTSGSISGPGNPET